MVVQQRKRNLINKIISSEDESLIEDLELLMGIDNNKFKRYTISELKEYLKQSERNIVEGDTSDSEDVEKVIKSWL